jgi:hypothetical protein
MRSISLVLLLGGCGTVAGGDGGPSEDCLDGTDDDSNGMPDCADPSCASVAICAPVPAGGFAAGVVIAAEMPCPEGFEAGETLIHQGLLDTGCDGCTCSPADTTCQADLWLYGTEAECQADTALTGGTYYGVITPVCTAEPVSFNYAGARGVITVTQQTCSVAGTPTPAPIEWTRSQKFCRASRQGTGCGAEQACVARRAAPSEQCALAEGAQTCTAYQSVESDWYTGADDQRTCGPCTCTGEGGSCDGLSIAIGTDYSCNTIRGMVTDGTRDCTGIYSPPALTMGAPTPPSTCSTASVATSATPPGQNTLCCTVQ